MIYNEQNNFLKIPEIIDNTHYNYLKVDNLYIKSLIINSYKKYIDFNELSKILPQNIKYDLAISVKKVNLSKILKDLTYKIGSTYNEIKAQNNNQIDFNLMNESKDEAIELRKKIQIDNEEVYDVKLIFTFFNSNLDILEKEISFFQNKIYSKGFNSNITNFRHLDFYLKTLPICKENKILSKFNNAKFTTSSLINLIPNITNSIFDENGIILGYNNKDNRLYCIDFFNKKYSNSNICILGSSGAGKSFFTKMMILKNHFNGIKQYVFDIENEYKNITLNLNQKYVDFEGLKEKFNIFEFFKKDLEDKENFFKIKIENIVNFIKLFVNITKSQEIELLTSIENMYEDFGISKNYESLFKVNSNERILFKEEILSKDKFPIFDDLLKYIKNQKMINSIKEKIIDKYPFFNGITTINDENLITFKLSNLKDIELVKIVMFIFGYLEKYKETSNHNYYIYIDEVWKYITLDEKIETEIVNLYKTIRKTNGGIVTITQDISDFFNFEDCKYGKIILNNSNFKFIFKIEYADMKILRNLSFFDDNIKQINGLNKGECILGIGENSMNLKIKVSEYEKKIMEEVYDDSNSFS